MTFPKNSMAMTNHSDFFPMKCLTSLFIQGCITIDHNKQFIPGYENPDHRIIETQKRY